MSRVLVVGEAPSSKGAYPGGASWRRLASLLGCAPEMIPGCNLLGFWPGPSDRGRKGSAAPKKAMEAAAHALITASRNGGVTLLVMLGGRVAEAFRPHVPLRAKQAPWFEPFVVQAGGSKAILYGVIVPHPSGVNRWWNEPRNQHRAAKHLRELLAGSLP